MNKQFFISFLLLFCLSVAGTLNARTIINPVPGNLVIDRIEICYFDSNGEEHCIGIFWHNKSELKAMDRLNLKASVSREGDHISFSGFPKNMEGALLGLKDPIFSGFIIDDKKQFLASGKYSVKKGRLNIPVK